MSGLAESMPEERELIAGALRPVERRLSADDWFDGDPVEIATNAVLPVVADLIAEAEKRGAVKALTFAAEVVKRSAAELAAATETPLVEGIVLGLATSIREYADQIESGEAKL